MYDAQMVAAGSLTPDKLVLAVANGNAVVERTRALFADAEFDKAVRTGTNTPARIRYRVQEMKKALEF